ncbi:hypothetical protein H8356DRAFT_1352256 [Neocallimastix lanati (nom. inval.)]|nr:hypothetical protein H8356DRAFT_1352256 [Neocallimastix sp. JGI-2020a]
MLNEESCGSGHSSLNFNNVPEKKKYFDDAVIRKEFYLDARIEIRKAKSNTSIEKGFRKNLKTITSKERIKIDESSQDLNNNNNHVINDNILNKEKEYKTNKVSNKNDDKSINVNTNNKPNKSIEED